MHLCSQKEARVFLERSTEYLAARQGDISRIVLHTEEMCRASYACCCRLRESVAELRELALQTRALIRDTRLALASLPDVRRYDSDSIECAQEVPA